jgi:hypothetical protein
MQVWSLLISTSIYCLMQNWNYYFSIASHTRVARTAAKYLVWRREPEVWVSGVRWSHASEFPHIHTKEVYWFKPAKPGNHVESHVSEGGWQPLHRMMQHYKIELRVNTKMHKICPCVYTMKSVDYNVYICDAYSWWENKTYTMIWAMSTVIITEHGSC